MEAIVETAPSANVEATTGHEPSAWDEPAPWREVFEGVAAGRREALARLYDLASKRMFGLALWRTGNAEDAGEVVQEAFVRVAEQRDRLATVRDPRWWLLEITHRIAIDVTRRRRPTEPLEDHPYLSAPAGDPGSPVDARRVSALVARLSPKQREVVYLHHYAGMSHSEIGRSLGIPTFTAASRYRLGLATLRRLITRTP
jgi:RNA polymerase sigma-70 factor (ECF subfamily)